MTEECKELEKNAKDLEKNEVEEAIIKYKQASECYSKHDKTKDKYSNLAKAAKLLRELGSSNEDPTIALDYYEEASAIFSKIEKEAEAEKVIQEAFQKFVDSAKLIILEARKMDDIEAAENRFKLASQYAKLGEDEILSNKSWIESGDQFYRAAHAIEDPREAFEVFKHSIINYNKGNATEKQNLVMTEAAEKFLKKGSEIYKTNKTLVLALDNYVQATTLYEAARSEQKLKDLDKRIQEICDQIGIPKEPILNYLDLQGTKGVSFGDAIQVITPEVVIKEVKQDIEIERAPEPHVVVEEKTIVEDPVITPTPEVIEEIREDLEPEVVKPKIHETIPEPQMEEIEIPPIEELVEEPFAEPVAETIMAPEPQMEEIEIPPIEELVEEPIVKPISEPLMIPEPQMEEIEIPPNEELVEEPFVEPIVEPVMIPRPQRKEEEIPPIEELVEEPIVKPIAEPVMVPEPQMEEEEIPKVEEPVMIAPVKVEEKFEEVRSTRISGLKPMTPLKQDLRHTLKNPSSEIQDYEKKSFKQDVAKDQLEDSNFAFKTGDLRTLSEPIINILREQGYISKEMTANDELLQVSEYQILLFLVNNHPVPLEEIEEKTDVISVSLSLSNLQADGLIEQTNDYQWTISQKVKDTIIKN